MIDLTTLSAELGIDRKAADAALARADGEAASPWYVRAFLAVGAWVTALAIVVFFSLLIRLVIDGRLLIRRVFDGDSFAFVATVLGVACFALGAGMLAKGRGGEFGKSFAMALAAAGANLATAGIGLAAGGIWVSVVVSLAFAALAVAFVPGTIVQLLTSGLAMVLIAVALLSKQVPYYVDIAAVLPVAGVVLWLHPSRFDMRASAFVLLLAAPASSVVARYGGDWLEIVPGGWGARAVHIALFLWLLSNFWQRMPGRGPKVELGVFAATAVAVCLLLLPGGSAALVVMMLAFVAGSRPLALLGVLLQAYFVWQFYCDLAISLQNKSLLLAAVGLAALACWWLIAGRKPGRADA